MEEKSLSKYKEIFSKENLFFWIIGVIFLSLAYLIDSYIGFILAFCFISMVIVLNGVYRSIFPLAKN
ncbi:hypothetical protein [Methanosarcina sp.]|uniref:hypothetical protein n=1 Tax=Methanosarcina sp. TaxID=2213 RepID=UPI003BB77D5C